MKYTWLCKVVKLSTSRTYRETIRKCKNCERTGEMGKELGEPNETQKLS
jgi:hypothetical protein